MYIVDVDTGGTMTDGLVSGGGQLLAVKVDTTPHDFTVCFRDCLAEAAKQLGFPGVPEFLEQVAFIRWSSTITTNVLGERRGSKIGLMVSEGHEKDLYGEDQSPTLNQLVSERNVIGLPRNPTQQDIMIGLKRLLEEGVRRICISLKGAYPDNAPEVAIKRTIEKQYPDHFLGAVPVLLGSEMAQVSDDNTRTHYSLINAYVHTQLATSLFKAEDVLRQNERWQGPLLIGHTNGGVARVGKTKAVDTIESGPIFGTFGGAHLAKRYKLRNVVCFDVGGTTTKASIVKEGKPVFQRGGKLVGIPVKTSLAMLRSAVVGGGSIARPNATGGIILGPESMGASPGPACYGLGGSEATLTDALITLGYLDPAGFLGGRRRLNTQKAFAAITQRVATPLSHKTEAAAQMIVDAAVTIMANLLTTTLQEGRLEPPDTALFAFGGNGPLFGALVAERLGIPRVYVYTLGPVFSAFGSAISDVVHVYERGLGVDLSSPLGKQEVASAVDSLLNQARRDLLGEGFSVDKAKLSLDMEIIGEEGSETTTSPKSITVSDRAAAEKLLARCEQIVTLRNGNRNVWIEALRLNVRYPVGSFALRKRKISERRAANPIGERTIHIAGQAVNAALFHWNELQAGDTLTGLAIAVAETLTCLIPPGWRVSIDGFGTAVLQKASSKTRTRTRGSQPSSGTC